MYSSLYSIHPITGLAKAKAEGTVNVHINDTVHLTSVINCGRVKEIQLEPTTAPKLLTNVERHREYQQRYRLQFRIYADDPSVDITPDPTKQSGLVSHNVAFECKSLNPSWILAKTEEDETKGQVKSAVCVLYPRAGPVSEGAPNTVSIEVSAGSKETQYMKGAVFSFPYASAFVLHSGKELVFSRANRTRTIRVTGSTDLKVWVDDPALADLKRLSFSGDNQVSIQITIPREVEHSFKRVIAYIESPLTGQKEELALSYYHEYIDVNGPTNGSDWGFSKTELGTVIILLVTLIIAVKMFIWPSNRAPEGGFAPPGTRPMAPYRTPVPGPRTAGRHPTTGDKLRIVTHDIA